MRGGDGTVSGCEQMVGIKSRLGEVEEANGPGLGFKVNRTCK